MAVDEMFMHKWLPVGIGVGGALLIDRAVPRHQRTMGLLAVAAASLGAWYATRPPQQPTPSTPTNPNGVLPAYEAPLPSPTSGLGGPRRRWKA